MGKVNKAMQSDPTVEELLLSLQIEGGSSDDGESEASEDAHVSGDELEYMFASGQAHSSPPAFDIGDLRRGEEYKISKGPLPFSLLGMSGQQRDSELAVVTSQKFVIEEGRHDYGFTPEDLKRYRIKRKKKVRTVCHNWEDVVEERRNEPTRIRVRSLAARNRR